MLYYVILSEITCDKQPEQVEVHSDYIVESEENTMILPEDSLELSNPLQGISYVLILNCLLLHILFLQLRNWKSCNL